MAATKRHLEHLRDRECVIRNPATGEHWCTIERQWLSSRWEVQSGDSAEYLAEQMAMYPDDFVGCVIEPVHS